MTTTAAQHDTKSTSRATRSNAPSRATGKTSGRPQFDADAPDLQEQLASLDAELLQVGADHLTRRDELVARKTSVEAALRVEQQEQAMIAAGEYGERLLGLTRGLIADEDAKLAAIQRAETCVRMLAIELGKVFAANDRLTKKAYEILQAVRPDDKRWMVPSVLSKTDLDSRLGQRLAAIMATVKGPNGRRLGYLEWRGSMHTDQQVWRDGEEAQSAEAIATLIETARSQF